MAEGCDAGESKYPGSDAIREQSKNDEVLRKFIETYESLPELWNSSHSSYMNKTKRNIALDKLLNIYIKIKPGADRFDVRRKINTLRSNYRKDLNKIVSSRRSGADEVYQPNSWLFYALQFLHSSEQPVNAKEQLNEIIYNEGGQDFAEQCPKPRLSAPSRSFITSPPSLAKRQRVVGPLAKQNELLSLACKYLMKSEPQDDVPTIAKVWGEKLVTLDTQQRLFAEKAINDVLFEASLGSLNRYSVKINEDPYQHSSVHSFHSTSRD